MIFRRKIIIDNDNKSKFTSRKTTKKTKITVGPVAALQAQLRISRAGSECNNTMLNSNFDSARSDRVGIWTYERVGEFGPFGCLPRESDIKFGIYTKFRVKKGWSRFSVVSVGPVSARAGQNRPDNEGRERDPVINFDYYYYYCS